MPEQRHRPYDPYDSDWPPREFWGEVDTQALQTVTLKERLRIAAANKFGIPSFLVGLCRAVFGSLPYQVVSYALMAIAWYLNRWMALPTSLLLAYSIAPVVFVWVIWVAVFPDLVRRINDSMDELFWHIWPGK